MLALAALLTTAGAPPAAANAYAYALAPALDDDELPVRAPRPARVAVQQPRVTVIGPTLQSVSGRLVSASPARAVLMIDQAPVTIELPLAVVVFLPDDPDRFRDMITGDPESVHAQEADGLWSIIDTTDGRRLIAPESRTNWSGQGVTIDQGALGLDRLRLEDLRRVRLTRLALLDEPAPVEPPAQDTLILASGERLTGFVSSITTPVEGTPELDRGIDGRDLRRGPPSAVLDLEPASAGTTKPAGGTGITKLSMLRIRDVLLSNPAVPASARVWLDRGNVLAGPASFEQGLWTGPSRTEPALPVGTTSPTSPSNPSGPWRTPWVAGVSYRPGALMPWSSLGPGTPVFDSAKAASAPLSPAQTRLLPDHDSLLASIGLADIELPEPMAVTWTLPVGTTRLAGTLALCETCRRWGDCEVSLELSADASDSKPKSLLAARLSGETPEQTFNIELPARGPNASRQQPVVTLRVIPSTHGGVQDRVLLRAGMLLLNPASDQPTKPRR